MLLAVNYTRYKLKTLSHGDFLRICPTFRDAVRRIDKNRKQMTDDSGVSHPLRERR